MTRLVTLRDLPPMDAYAVHRSDERRRIMAVKAPRRVSVGPFATFLFENFDTLRYQILEMLYAEKGGAEQVPDELEAYNPLIPRGNEFVATLMLEIDDRERRNSVLRRLTGIETTTYLDVDGDRIHGRPETDADRTAPDGKTSAVHFIRFPLTRSAARRFQEDDVHAVLGIAHAHHAHDTPLSAATRRSLSADLLPPKHGGSAPA